MFPNTDPETVTKLKAMKDDQLQDWIDRHCLVRNYMFQVGKIYF